MKKIFKLGLATMTTVAPIAAVVSCGKTTQKRVVHRLTDEDRAIIKQTIEDNIASNLPTNPIKLLGDWSSRTGSLDTSAYTYKQYTLVVRGNGSLGYGNIAFEVREPENTATDAWLSGGMIDIVVRDPNPVQPPVTLPPIFTDTTSTVAADNKKITDLLKIEVKPVPRFSYETVSNKIRTLENENWDIERLRSQWSLWINHATQEELAKIPTLVTRIQNYNADIDKFTIVKNELDMLTDINKLPGLTSYSSTSNDMHAVKREIDAILSSWTTHGVSFTTETRADPLFHKVSIKLVATDGDTSLTREIDFFPSPVTQPDATQIEQLILDIWRLKGQIKNTYESFVFPASITFPKVVDRTALRDEINRKEAEAKSSSVLADVQRLHDEVHNLVLELGEDTINRMRAYNIWITLLVTNNLNDVFDENPEIESLRPANISALTDPELTTLINSINIAHGGSLTLSLAIDLTTRKITVTHNRLGVKGVKEIDII